MGTWHARLSASDTKRWWYSPGVIAIEEQFPELKKEGSGYAREGTCAHRLVEECLINNKDAVEWKGRVIRIILDKDGKENGTSILRKGAKLKDENDFLVDMGMIEAVQHCVDYVRGVLDIYTGSPDTALAIKNGTLHVEERVNPLPHRDDTGGTGDILIDIFPELFEVVDYKHGMGVFVPVEDNPQTLTYLRGGQVALGATGYEKYQHTICQPRHRETPHNGIMSAEVTEAELDAWAAELDKRATRVDQAREHLAAMISQFGLEDPETHMEQMYTGGYLSAEPADHRRFCDLKAICPALRNKAQELAAVDFAEEDAEEYERESIGPNMMAVVLPWVDVMVDYFQHVRKEAEARMLDGEKVPGWKVVAGKSPGRKLKADVTPEDAVKLAVELGAEEEDCYSDPKPAAPLSGPKLEKLVPSKSRKEFSEKTMFKPDPPLTIAPESDKRKEVTVNAKDDFAEE